MRPSERPRRSLRHDGAYGAGWSVFAFCSSGCSFDCAAARCAAAEVRGAETTGRKLVRFGPPAAADGPDPAAKRAAEGSGGCGGSFSLSGNGEDVS